MRKKKEEIKEEVFNLDSKENGLMYNLRLYVGKRVMLRMNSGEELWAMVTNVGTVAVHLSVLEGRSDCHAVVQLDQVSALIVKRGSQ